MPVYTMKEYHLLKANKMGQDVFALVSVDKWDEDRETQGGEEFHDAEYYFDVHCQEVKNLGIVQVKPDDLKLDGFDLPELIGHTGY